MRALSFFGRFTPGPSPSRSRIFLGAEAIVQALATRRLFAWVAPVYYLPGLRQVLNGLYTFVAANRYRFWGKTASPSECESGVCRIHGT